MMNNNNNKKNPNRRRRRRNRNRRPRRVNAESSYRLSVPTANQMNMPDSMVVDLPFTDTSDFVPSAVFGNFRYRGNSPFDPDPLIGGDSALFFATYASLYRYYRVVSVKLEVTFVNNESFPVLLTFAPTDTDITGSLSSAARCADLGEMSYGRRPITLAGVNGMNKQSFTKVIKWPKFTGDYARYMADDLFSSLNNNNPSHVLFLQFAIFSAGNAINVGISRNVRIIYRVLWTDRNFLFANLRTKPEYKKKKENDEDEAALDLIQDIFSAKECRMQQNWSKEELNAHMDLPQHFWCKLHKEKDCEKCIRSIAL